MARKKFEDEPDNHERWLVSYADLVTLLFAFFVVMYAISSVNEGKYRVLSNALGSAFGRPQAIQIVVPIPDNTPGLPRVIPSPAANAKQRASEAALRREKEQMTSMARDLQKVMAPLVDEGKVRVTQTPLGISLEINASVLFGSGETQLNRDSIAALAAVARVLANDTHAIQVEGHTDNTPIKTPLYPSNWELSAVRAGSVIRLFIEQGIAESRVTAIGRASTRPVAANDTAEGRARNRRVEVLILAELPKTPTEVPVGQQ
jgi:chemotaxis protein MotB